MRPLRSLFLLALLVALLPAWASAQYQVKWSKESGNIAYNCTSTGCDLGPFATLNQEGFSCYVYNGSNAARNVTVTLYRDDGTTIAYTSANLSCPATTYCSVTVHPQATTAVANNAVVPMVPTRRAKVTVAAAGTSGNATAFCLGR